MDVTCLVNFHDLIDNLKNFLDVLSFVLDDVVIPTGFFLSNLITTLSKDRDKS